MGAVPYFYFVKYQEDAQAALDALREREFVAGRYNPVIWAPALTPVNPNQASPGAQHASIEEALEAAAEDGTRSILELDHVCDQREFCAACRLPDEVLEELYGTTQPTRQMIEQNMDFMEDVERGQGVYVVAYRNGKPHELFFGGYSFD